MPPGGSRQEIEIKLPLESAEAGRGLLRKAGFRIVRKRAFEANTVFDTPRGELRRRGELLRLRQTGPHSWLTFKGPSTPGKHKSRPEIEVEVSNPLEFQEVLLRLGFRAVFRYEKYRTEYRKRGEQGLATLDETPIGVFFELEGPPRWIDRTARELGFHESHYFTISYGEIYLAHCRQMGIPAAHMVFSHAM